MNKLKCLKCGNDKWNVLAGSPIGPTVCAKCGKDLWKMDYCGCRE